MKKCTQYGIIFLQPTEKGAKNIKTDHNKLLCPRQKNGAREDPLSLSFLPLSIIIEVKKKRKDRSSGARTSSYTEQKQIEDTTAQEKAIDPGLQP